MGQTAYPALGDLMQFLLSHPSVTATSLANIDLAAACRAGRLDFETAVGRTMLGITQTRTFDPPYNPRAMLDLRADLASLTSLTIQGVTKVLNTDFYLGPPNADADGLPWRWIEIAAWWPNYRVAKRGISITGVWGFATTIPDDAWQAMLCQSALKVASQLISDQTGGLSSVQIGEIRESYGANPLSGMIDPWKIQIASAVQQYTLVTVGL